MSLAKLTRKWRAISYNTYICAQGFRSNAALEALATASENNIQTVVLYNYPSFSGAFSALFAYRFHSLLQIPCLVLPFSSVEPLRVEDVCIDGLKTCYFLDFIGPKGFATELARRTLCQVIAFDHRKSVVSRIAVPEDCSQKLMFHVNVEKSSSNMAYEYFSARLLEMRSNDAKVMNLLDWKEQDRVEQILKYIEDSDLRRWTLEDIKAFNIGLNEWRSHLNCITNPHMYKQLLELSCADLISKGDFQIHTRQEGAKKFLEKVFRVRLGRGFYGDCLGVRADANPSLSDEIGKELSIRSSAAGLRPIGAVIYMQKNNLKMCLRSMDKAADTSEVAKVCIT